jgi:hypothetical protein
MDGSVASCLLFKYPQKFRYQFDTPMLFYLIFSIPLYDGICQAKDKLYPSLSRIRKTLGLLINQ